MRSPTLYACVVSTCLGLCFSSAIESRAHEHDGAHVHAAASSSGNDEPSIPAGFVLPQTRGPRPWSDKPVLNDPNRFQIAIMTDRTGGHRPGVWMDAVRKINLLRPEFVMSVGDLIEGYTEDEAQLEREWAEFLGFIDQLQMRFFFVAGNHDLANPVMHRMWREKFGEEWYSFDYRGVHFLCLCSEDPVNRIGDEQLAWVRKDLEQHADARWTLVFVHKPLWTYAERAKVSGNPDKTNWKQVQSMLAGRPHTVFAGHVHHYVQYERNGGMKYYALATTGGGSQLRGDAYGEFDHIMWLTMEADGPHLAVLKLDGILAPGVVTEEYGKRFHRFLETARIEVAPILIDDHSGFAGGDVHVRLVNEFGEEVQADCEISGLPLRGLSVEPAKLSLRVGPTGTAEQSVRVGFAESIDFSRLSHTTLTAKLSTTGGKPLTAEIVAPVVIDQRHACPLIAKAPVIDGVTEPWPENAYSTPEQPQLIEGGSAWTGPGDGSLAFHTSHDSDRLYFAVRVTDERLEEGDQIELLIDGRTIEERRVDPLIDWGACRVVVSAPLNGKLENASGSAMITGRESRPLEEAQIATRPINGGYAVEVSLPKRVVTHHQGDDWHSYQLAIVQHDVDEPGGAKTRILWRGSPEVDTKNDGYGYFVRSTDN